MASEVFIESVTVTCHTQHDSIGRDHLDVYHSKDGSETLIGSAAIGAGETVTVNLTQRAVVEDRDFLLVRETETLSPDASIAVYLLDFRYPHAQFTCRDDVLQGGASYTFTVRLGGLDAAAAPTDRGAGGRTAAIESITATCHTQKSIIGSDQIDVYHGTSYGTTFLGSVSITAGETKEVPIAAATVRWMDHILVKERDIQVDDSIAFHHIDKDARDATFTSDPEWTDASYTFAIRLSEWSGVEDS